MKLKLVYCKHKDCEYYIRHNGDEKRILGRVYFGPNDEGAVEFKCKACRQNSTYSANDFHGKIDKQDVPSLKLLLDKKYGNA